MLKSYFAYPIDELLMELLHIVWFINWVSLPYILIILFKGFRDLVSNLHVVLYDLLYQVDINCLVVSIFGYLTQ